MMLKKVIVEHLKKVHILLSNQHGFRKEKSTVTQLLEMFNDWTNALGSKTDVDVVFNMSEALKGAHFLLSREIQHTDIYPRIVGWIQVFLSCRTFRLELMIRSLALVRLLVVFHKVGLYLQYTSHFRFRIACLIRGGTSTL